MLALKKKSGFIALSDVVIKDRRGNYFFNCPKNYVGNLPAGKYSISGRIKLLDYITATMFKLPPKEREIIPKYFTYRFVNNPNKATNKFNSLVSHLSFDKKYTKEPVFVLNFLLGHEIGHFHYHTESFCDLFACNYCLQKGFNKEQLKQAAFLLFEDKKRFNFLLKKLNEI